MRSRRRIALAAAGLALVLAAAACQRPDASRGVATAGGAAPRASGAGGAAAGQAGGVDEASWVRCLRDRGLKVTYPDPDSGSKPQLDERSVPPGKLTAAVQACQRFNPNYGRKAPPMDAATRERWRQFARCMRANGVDMADPGPDAARPPIPEGPDVPRGQPPSPAQSTQSAQLDSALRTCAEKVPGLVTTSNDGPKGTP